MSNQASQLKRLKSELGTKKEEAIRIDTELAAEKRRRKEIVEKIEKAGYTVKTIGAAITEKEQLVSEGIDKVRELLDGEVEDTFDLED